MSKRALYNCIKDVINKIELTTQKKEKFTCEGLFNDQFAREIDEDVINYPAVFVQFDPIVWEGLSGQIQGTQEGDVTIVLHVGFKQLDKDNDYILDEVDNIHAALNGLKSDFFSPIKRIEEVQDTSYDNVEVWLILLKTNLTDTSAAIGNNDKTTVTEFEIRPHVTISLDNNLGN